MADLIDPTVRAILQIAATQFGSPALGSAVGAAAGLANRLWAIHGERLKVMTREEVAAAVAALPELPTFEMEAELGGEE